jgi:DSF synthase
VTLDELQRVVDIWADAALDLTDQDLRMMERLVSAQNRLLGLPVATAAE